MPRYSTHAVVYLVMFRDNNGQKEILLHKRQNTGYMDNKYDIGASGHLEEGESLTDAVIREGKEELGVDVKKDDIYLASFFHAYEENYLRFFFVANRYDGEPSIMEADKSSELLWASVNNLPDELVPHLRIEIANVVNKVIYDESSMEIYE